MTVRHCDNVIELETVLPGGTIRWGIFAPDGRRSPSWRVWTSKQTDDCYVAGRDVAGEVKISLHASGEWQHSITQPAAARRALAERHLDRWVRPPDFAPGWTVGVRVWIPDSELREWPSSEPPEAGRVLAVPLAEQGNATLVTVYVEEPNSAMIELDNALPVGRLMMASGTSALVVATRESLPDRWRSRFAVQLDEAAHELAADPPGGWHTPRIAVYGRNDDEHWIFELAVDL